MHVGREWFTDTGGVAQTVHRYQARVHKEGACHVVASHGAVLKRAPGVRNGTPLFVR
jgi:hypothetical protein